MKINEIKKTKYGYNIFTDQEKVNLETFIFSKYKIKKNQTIDLVLWQQILEENKVEFIKRKALTYLNRSRSTKEFFTYLYKLNAPIDLIKILIYEYTEKGYLNDFSYASEIAYKESFRYGNRRIRQILINKGIKTDIINSLLTEEEKDILEPRIKKSCSTIKADNYQAAKEKILRSYLNRGYLKKDIEEFISLYLEKDRFNEEETIKKHYLALLKKYENKYSGEQLIFKIKQSLYTKGFSKKTIDKIKE